MKYAENGNLDAACKEALKQIEENRYTTQTLADGMTKIIRCGIACHIKNCKVVFEIT